MLAVDHIDLQSIDAKKGGGGNKFIWIGKAHFHGKKGELHYVKKAGYVAGGRRRHRQRQGRLQIKVEDVSKLSADDFVQAGSTIIT
ncbi:MAG: hypothetical protein R3D30_06630 [Hyphomicrobiales bacterium]